jgi:hypothetical protein
MRTSAIRSCATTGLLSLLFAASPGCIAYRADRVADLGPLVHRAGPPPVAELTYQVLTAAESAEDGILTGTTGPPAPVVDPEKKQAAGSYALLERLLAESGCFRSTRAAHDGGDAHLDVELVKSSRHTSAGDAWFRFSMVTVTVIPVLAPRTIIHVKATLRMRDGRSATCALDDELNLFVWLPFLLFDLCTWSSQIDPAKSDLEESLLREALRKITAELLPPAAARSSP